MTIPEPGSQFHFEKSGFIYVTGKGSRVFSEISRRGQELEVTQDMIDASLDRNGRTWLQYIADEQAQLDRWGSVIMRPGAAPTNADGTPVLSPWQPDNQADKDQERARRTDQLVGVGDAARGEALAAIDRDLGKQAGSVTLNSRGGER